MDTKASARPVRRQLIQPPAVAVPLDRHDGGTRHSAGHGNGVRVHAIYFAAVSLAALLLILGAALATTGR